jgi:hypothetical protein
MNCRVCNIDKEISLMVKHKNDRICKSCNSIIRKAKYNYKTRSWSIKEDYKICRECNNELSIDNFCKHKGGKYGVDSICKPCAVLTNNTLEGRIRAIEWSKNNKDIVNKRAIARDKFKVKTDPEYRIKKYLRIRFWEVINKNKSTKSKSILNIMGCTVQEYRNNLESQFKPEMTWENHGKIWEIDHIIPLSLFNLTKEEEQKKGFHHSNTQPLFKTTKIAKSFGYNNEIGNRDKSDNI